jgi:restriction system protein
MANVWMVRAGEGGYLIEEFERGYVGLGWRAVGSLRDVSSLEDIRELYAQGYPDASPGNVRGGVAMLYKFRSVMTVGDKVITYDRGNREYLIGTVTSDYLYKPGEIKDYNHIRTVKWEEGRMSRDKLSASSRNSLGSALTLFAVDEDVWRDVESLLRGERMAAADEQTEEEREELEQIREDVLNRAHELIKDKILALHSDDLERLTAAILRAMGYRTRVSPKGPDRGVDVFASPDGLGLEEPRIKAEVKHRPKDAMGSQDIRSFLGGLRQGDRGLYVSTGGYSKDAKYEADRSNIPITLINLDDLAELIVTYYETFDTQGRALIPLDKVYWPRE